MAYNWLMMTSSGDDNWLSGSLGLLTDKLKKKINQRQSKKLPSLQLRGLTKRDKLKSLYSGNLCARQIHENLVRCRTKGAQKKNTTRMLKTILNTVTGD